MHIAAESHIYHSLGGHIVFLQTNIVGIKVHTIAFGLEADFAHDCGNVCRRGACGKPVHYQDTLPARHFHNLPLRGGKLHMSIPHGA